MTGKTGINIHVSVIVVCFNEERNIGACLDALIRQDFHGREIIVVDGNSTDRTREIVEEYRRKYEEISLVLNPKRTIASNRNVGVGRAKAPLVAFTDADCAPPPDWLSGLVAGYRSMHAQDKSVAAVGSGNTPPAQGSPFLVALGIVQNTFLGNLGSAQGMRFAKPRPVASLAALNVLYEKAKIVEAGLFDEDMGNMCEDADLNYRLRQNGYKLVYLPAPLVMHRYRSDLRKWGRNMFAYGKGRALLMRKHRTIMSPVYLLPLLFLPAIGSALLSVIHPLFLIPLLYFPIMAGFSVSVVLRARRPLLFPHVVCIYIAQHFSYAAGEAYGLLVKR
jgi:GT2 family glycosyltransferase